MKEQYQTTNANPEDYYVSEKSPFSRVSSASSGSNSAFGNNMVSVKMQLTLQVITHEVLISHIPIHVEGWISCELVLKVMGREGDRQVQIEALETMSG